MITLKNEIYDKEGYKLIYIEFPKELNHLNSYKVKNKKIKYINKKHSKGSNFHLLQVIDQENP